MDRFRTKRAAGICAKRSRNDEELAKRCFPDFNTLFSLPLLSLSWGSPISMTHHRDRRTLAFPHDRNARSVAHLLALAHTTFS